MGVFAPSGQAKENGRKILNYEIVQLIQTLVESSLKTLAEDDFLRTKTTLY